MNSTALGAENIIFISEAHEKFFHEKLKESGQYSAEELFCCAYAPFFGQAVQIRYPEYARYNYKLHAMLGGAD